MSKNIILKRNSNNLQRLSLTLIDCHGKGQANRILSSVQLKSQVTIRIACNLNLWKIGLLSFACTGKYNATNHVSTQVCNLKLSPITQTMNGAKIS